MKNTQKDIRLHRFGDLVALDMTDTKQLYLTKDVAYSLAMALMDYVEDIETIDYTESELNDTNIKEG